MLIPVICPVFGHRDQARPCVEHLQQQSQPVNVTILNNSDDPSTFTRVINEELHRLLSEKHEWVMIIHPDVTLEPTATERMIDIMVKRPQCGIVTPVVQLSSLPKGQAMGGGLDTFPYAAQRIASLEELRVDQKIHWAAWSCVILRVEMIRQIGLLDENMAMICSDSDYCFTARTRGWEIWRAGTALAWHEHGQSDPAEDSRLEQIKLQDMIFFGRKWLTGDLYRDLAYEGEKCTPQWIDEAMQQFTWALKDLDTKQRRTFNDDSLPRAEVELLQQAQQAHRQGNLAEAETRYRELLERQCHHPVVLHGMGLIAYQEKRYDDAVDFFVQAIEVSPETSSYHLSLGLAYQAQQRHALAIQALQKTLNLNSGLVEAWQLRATSLAALEYVEEAIEHLKQAVTLRPDSAQLLMELGRLLHRQERPSEAVVEYKHALYLRPDLAEAHFELAQVYRSLNDLDAAYHAAQQAVSLTPQHAGYHSLLAAIRQDQGLLDDAMESCHKVIELMPDRAEAYYNLACLQRDQGRLDEAMATQQQAIDRDPEFAQAHWAQTTCRLLAQQYSEAWRGYHWRHRLYHTYPHTHTQPPWEGQSFVDQTLLIHSEQHLSDTLHWLRLLPQVKRRGGTVVLAVWNNQVDLFRHALGVDYCIGFDAKTAPQIDCDWVVSLLDLPGVLEVTPQGCPLEPSLLSIPSDPHCEAYDLLGTERNIGIVTTGINTHHSTDLRDWIPLLQQTQATFFHLQAESLDLRDRQLLNELNVHYPFTSTPNLLDLAGLINQLDLIIAVNSPLLLLSVILNRPTWGLIATSPDWRWLLTGDHSPWYPEVTLYRQQTPEQWEEVFTQLVDDLKD